MYFRNVVITISTYEFQLYAENKKRFERDLRGFMNQQGKTIQKPPVWHGIELNLFQLYMAIHDLGGSDMVSSTTEKHP